MVTHLKPNIEIWQFLLIFPSLLAIDTLENCFIFIFLKLKLLFFGEISPVKEGFTTVPTLGNCYYYHYYYFQFCDVAELVEIIHNLL